MGYKIKNDVVGFPAGSLNKVIGELEKRKISYMVLDSRNDYEVDIKEDYKGKNRYHEFFKIGERKETNLKDIEDIYKKLKLRIVDKGTEVLLANIKGMINDFGS